MIEVLSSPEHQGRNIDSIISPLESSEELEKQRMTSSSDIVNMFYELGLKRWGGESAYPVSSERVRFGPEIFCLEYSCRIWSPVFERGRRKLAFLVQMTNRRMKTSLNPPFMSAPCLSGFQLVNDASIFWMHYSTLFNPACHIIIR